MKRSLYNEEYKVGWKKFNIHYVKKWGIPTDPYFCICAAKKSTWPLLLNYLQSSWKFSKLNWDTNIEPSMIQKIFFPLIEMTVNYSNRFSLDYYSNNPE